MDNRYLKRLIDDLVTDKGKAAIVEPNRMKILFTVAGQGENGLRNIAILWMLFGSGMRINEVAQLKVKDVVYADGSIAESFLIPGAYTKTSDPRYVYILIKHQRNALCDWISLRKKTNGMTHANSSYGGLRPDSPLFFLLGITSWRAESMRVCGRCEFDEIYKFMLVWFVLTAFWVFSDKFQGHQAQTYSI